MGNSRPIHVVHVTRSSLVHGLASSLLRTQCTPRGAKFQSLEAKENILLFVVFFSILSSRCVYITSALVWSLAVGRHFARKKPFSSHQGQISHRLQRLQGVKISASNAAKQMQ